MASGLEFAFDLVQLKVASLRLQKLASDLDANKLQFTFGKSKGETAQAFTALIAKYNELGSALAQLVNDVKVSTDMTREGLKNADEHLSSCWGSIGEGF